MATNLGKPVRLRNDSGAQLELDRSGTATVLTGSGGNLGLGVTPSAWDANRKVIQNLDSSWATVPSAPNLSLFYTNAYTDVASTDRYISSNFATLFRQGEGQFQFFTAPSGTAENAISFTQAMTLDASGRLLVGKTTATANGGDVQVSSGITFPATQVASADANTLDDYEEGTWTPGYAFSTSGSVTMNVASSGGVYTKIGNIVIATCRLLTLSISSPTGDVEVTGLPFTSAFRSPVSIGEAVDFATDMPNLRGYSNSSSTTVTFEKNATNAAGTRVQGSDFSGGSNANLLLFTTIYSV
jgi:hypothetical protein